MTRYKMDPFFFPFFLSHTEMMVMMRGIMSSRVMENGGVSLMER